MWLNLFAAPGAFLVDAVRRSHYYDAALLRNISAVLWNVILLLQLLYMCNVQYARSHRQRTADIIH